jgi:hypothetical protein
MKLGFTYLFLSAGKPRKNDEINILLPVPVCSGLGNVGNVLKLGITYLFMWACKPRGCDEIRIHLPVRVSCQS